ncbi:MAG: acyl-CoA/acyl-ACP dehydrogenase [Candidatus Rokubacteria bacterium]|nr:acyl-CoA/acyl-ACP dehydrogenase [Candidatus Rokubacteria bacterium]
MIGDPLLTAEESAYRDEASARIHALIPPDLPERMDRNEILYPKEYLREMAKHRYLGVPVPAALNGGGRDILADALVNELAGYWGSAALACCRSFTSHGGVILWKYGSPYLHDHYLRPTLAGDKFVCQALTEPGAGSDAAAIQTTAERRGTTYVLNGQKRFIDGAQSVDYIIVAAKVRPGGHEALAMFCVDTDRPGYAIKEVQADWMGFRGLGSAWIAFENVEIPVENRIGEESEGWKILMEELAIERVVATRAQLGQARRALQIAANYAEHRRTFGRRLRDHQWIAFTIADLAARLDAAALLNTRAARLLGQGLGKEARLEVSMAKLQGVETAWQVIDESLQILGGIGYTKKYPLERMLRDVRASRFTAGSTEMMRLIIQEEVFERLRDPAFRGEFVGNELAGSPLSPEGGQ